MRADFWHLPPDARHREQILDTLAAHFAALKVEVIGHSLADRPIHALTLGRREGGVLYTGGIHSLEWITTLLLLRLMTDLLDRHAAGTELAGVDIRRAMQERGITLVPCLNPDGVELVLGGFETAGDFRPAVEAISGGDLSDWQANLHGVDLNRNFDAGFAEAGRLAAAEGITRPAPRRYGGKAPHSEPETQAIVRYIEETRPRALYAFHAQGEEIYCGYGAHTPERARLMGEVLAAVSGYTLTEPDPVAGHGGLKDWFVAAFHRPGFTVEVGRGKSPLPAADLIPIYERLREMLVLGIIL